MAGAMDCTCVRSLFRSLELVEDLSDVPRSGRGEPVQLGELRSKQGLDVRDDGHETNTGQRRGELLVEADVEPLVGVPADSPARELPGARVLLDAGEAVNPRSTRRAVRSTRSVSDLALLPVSWMLSLQAKHRVGAEDTRV